MESIPKIDARGKPCPQPLILTQKALGSMGAEGLVVLVDNVAARKNVTRFVQRQGYQLKSEAVGTDFELTILPASPPAQSAAQTPPALDQPSQNASPADQQQHQAASQQSMVVDPNVVVYLASDRMAQGDPELGQILMRAFLQTLPDVRPMPGKLIFINAGIMLTTSGSVVLPALKTLEKMGVVLLSCGTCLDYYQRLDQLQVGQISNMLEIATALVTAQQIISP